MPIKDLLLHIDSYPDPTSAEAIEEAVRFANFVGASLTGLAVAVTFNARSNWLAERLINFNGMIEEMEAESRAACAANLATFQSCLRAGGVAGEGVTVSSDAYFVGETLAAHARTRDLCLAPTSNPVDGQRSVAEILAFTSGRPVILYKAGATGLLSGGLQTAVIAWDGSRCAARALSDAMPLLSRAKKVRVVTVVNEKPGARSGLGRDVVRHLGLHGLTAICDEIDGEGQKVGPLLEAYARKHGSDLLVMGAYGHSRFQEFFLGGATEHLMRSPPLPLLLSH